MTRPSSESMQLNASNFLMAHQVSAGISDGLVEASLRLTAALFPDEPGADARLREAYNACIVGHNRIGILETLSYSIYTVGREPDLHVVGAGGVYRLVEVSPNTQSILDVLRNKPPGSVSFLRNQVRSINEFVWGGRLYIEPLGASSPKIMPFIILHILSTAQAIVRAGAMAPVLLAFTRRNDNDRVKQFYDNLGFENTGATLSYADETQDVFCLNLDNDAPAMTRLKALIGRVSR
jgi:hypothetical protein